VKLILKLIAGIAAGILVGLFAPEWLARLLVTFKVLFGELLFFTVPLLILFYITSGITGLPRNSGALLGRTLGTAYASTLLAGLLAYLVAAILVRLLSGTEAAVEEVSHGVLLPFIALEIPPLLSVMSALTAAFIFGLGIAATGAETLKKVFDQGRDVIEKLLVTLIIPLLPFYIAGIFADLAAAGSVFDTLQTFGIVLLLAVSLHWTWIMVLFTIAGLSAGKSPFALVKGMLPAYFTALGTMSSAATIPVTLQSARDNGVRDNIASFTVPLCATVHLSGSTITIVSCAIAVTVLREGLAMPGLFDILPFIMMLGVVMMAAPGVPGGAVMAAVGLLSSMLGFGEVAIALMIALYMAQDSFGTAANVTGDGAIAMLIDRAAGEAGNAQDGNAATSSAADSS